MRTRVRFFGKHREVVGGGDETYDLPVGSTLADLLKALTERHPELRGMLDGAVYSVNFRVAEKVERLKDGDEVAVIPPVGGG